LPENTPMKKRRKKKDRTAKKDALHYPEGSTFNAKTLHLKPQKTMRFSDF
jgi:hypothetical protein